MKPRFFRTSADFRAWLDKNHATADELLVGFWKQVSGKPSMTYHQALDEALCYGWIDGVRRGGEDHHTIRFTPRRAKSKWSAINVNHAKRLIGARKMQAAGLSAYEARGSKAGLNYSYETRRPMDPALAAKLRANTKAWAFFTAQPPGYQRIATWWVMNAKQEATRARRFAQLLADSAKGQRLGVTKRPAAKKGG